MWFKWQKKNDGKIKLTDVIKMIGLIMTLGIMLVVIVGEATVLKKNEKTKGKTTSKKPKNRNGDYKVDENLRQIENGSGHIGLTWTLADYTAVVSDYHTVKELLVPFFTIMVMTFKSTGTNLLVKIMGIRGDGSYSQTAVIESTITAGAAASVKTAVGPYSGLKIMVKPAVAGLNGVLSSVVCFTDIATE